MIVDTGCTRPIFTVPKQCIDNFTAKTTAIGLAKRGDKLLATGEGTLFIDVRNNDGSWAPMQIQHMLHAPLACASLMPIIRFTDKKLIVVFTEYTIEIKRSLTSAALISGKRRGDLYYIKFSLKNEPKEETAFSAAKDDVYELHCTYNHKPLRVLR